MIMDNQSLNSDLGRPGLNLNCRKSGGFWASRFRGPDNTLEFGVSKLYVLISWKAKREIKSQWQQNIMGMLCKIY